MNKRESMILDLLSKHGKLNTAVLAEKLGVSQVTVRKDLDALEGQHVIRRVHGYAIFGGSNDINNRLAIHYEEKRNIARKAATLVEDGETLMIESGSCCTLLAEQIASAKVGATIITNSAFIAGYIRHAENARVILLGGDFQNGAQVTVGPILRACARQFHVDKLFVGADGYSEKLGFTVDDHLRMQAVRDMAEQANHVIVVTESDKFLKNSVVQMDIPAGVHAVVTDREISEEAQAALARSGVEVLKT